MDESFRYSHLGIFSIINVSDQGNRALYNVSGLGENFLTTRILAGRPAWSYIPEVVEEATEARSLEYSS